MVYDWPTLLACDNATVPLQKSGRCQFQQPSFSGGSNDGTSHLIDLRYFSSVTIDGFVSERGRSKVNLQPCGPNPLCSPPGSICGKGLQGGKVDDWVGLAGGVESAVLNINSDEIVVQFSPGGLPCRENVLQNRTAEIRLVCDMSLTSCTGYPVYEFGGLPCHDVFKWRTKLVCPDAQLECPKETGGGSAFQWQNNSRSPHTLAAWSLLLAFVATVTMALAFVGRRYGLHRHHNVVGRRLSEAAGWVSRQWGHIRTGQSATVDDDHFLISGDIQVPTFGSLQQEDDEDLILA